MDPQHASARRFLKVFLRGIWTRLESCWSCQFKPTTGATGVERTFQFDESWGVASKNPHVRVWRLFPQERRHQSGYPSDFYLYDVACRLVFGVAAGYRFFALWKDLKFNHPGLWSSRNQGHCSLWNMWLDVLHQGKQQSICDIGRQVTPLLQHLLS